MALRDEMASSGQRYAQEAAARIPKSILSLNACDFSSELFAELQKPLRDYVRTISYTTRIDAVKEINAFFDSFFQSRFGKVCRLERVFDGIELDILLLKALQGGTDVSLYDQSQADRAESFGMSTNAIQARIHGLEDGKKILGHCVKVSIDGRGRVAYDNTIHPVFLTLNLKEAYMLTIALRQTFVGSPFEDMAAAVSNDVYAQLSDYAKSVIDPHALQCGMNFDAQEPDAGTAYRREEQDVVFFLKSQQECILQMIDGASYRGRIEQRSNGFVLLTDDGRELPFPDDRSVYTVTQAL